MTLSCLFITDLQGKSIISRNYRGDVGVTQSIDTFQRYLSEVEDEAKTPVFHVDVHGDVAPDPQSVGAAGESLFRWGRGGVGGAAGSNRRRGMGIRSLGPFFGTCRLKSVGSVRVLGTTSTCRWHRQGIWGIAVPETTTEAVQS